MPSTEKIEDLVRKKGAGLHLNHRKEKVMNSDDGDDGYGLVVPIKPPPPSDWAVLEGWLNDNKRPNVPPSKKLVPC